MFLRALVITLGLMAISVAKCHLGVVHTSDLTPSTHISEIISKDDVLYGDLLLVSTKHKLTSNYCFPTCMLGIISGCCVGCAQRDEPDETRSVQRVHVSLHRT